MRNVRREVRSLPPPKQDDESARFSPPLHRPRCLALSFSLFLSLSLSLSLPPSLLSTMKTPSFLFFSLSSLLSLSLFACASPTNTVEDEPIDAQSEELTSSRPPSRECGAVAKAAVRAIEGPEN
jgi:hypothetical protein